MNAIANLRNFQRRRAFIAPLPIDAKHHSDVKKAHSANGNWFQICSLRLCQSLHDEK
jgi:hypothetical protein